MPRYRILKDEFHLDRTFVNFEQVFLAIKEAVYVYNHHRPHSSCNYLTPEAAHFQKGKLKKRWKNYYKDRKNELKEELDLSLN